MRLLSGLSLLGLMGKANAELCDFLAKEFGVGRSKVEVVAGRASHRKQVVIS